MIEGTFKIFSSARGEIGVDALLASAAIPNLFPAVWVDGHAYWDGIFASNPPIIPFLQKPYMGNHAMPDEIWIIQVNPLRKESVPEIPSDIFDRRNQLAGNLSLQHELQLIDMVNMLLQEGALTDRFRARFGLDDHRSHHGAIHSDVRGAAAGPRLPEQAFASTGPHRHAHGRRRGPGQGVPCQALGRRAFAGEDALRGFRSRGATARVDRRGRDVLPKAGDTHASGACGVERLCSWRASGDSSESN